MSRSCNRRAHPFLALLGLAMLLAAGCESVAGSQYRFAEVRVLTTNQWGHPVSGIPVVLYTPGAQMGSGITRPETGEYVFTEVAAGSYGVAINPPGEWGLGAGASAHVDTLQIRQGERHEVTFVLYPVNR